MYNSLIAWLPTLRKNVIWKLKFPLKVKIFVWYLQKGVVLTKYNIARRQLKGSLKCCFCSMGETIRYLFFDCQMARFMWRIVQVSFNITPPINIEHMFTGWLNGISKKLMYKIMVGASTLCCAIWLSRNDMVFNNTRAVTLCRLSLEGPIGSIFWRCCRKRTSGLTLFRGVVCLRPRQWRYLHVMDGLLSNRIAFT
jgi:hypothetical protein